MMLNLISNGFYAATKRKSEGNGGGYEPITSGRGMRRCSDGMVWMEGPLA